MSGTASRDSFLHLLDQHIRDQKAQQEANDTIQNDPASRLKALRPGGAAAALPTPKAPTLTLSPLERALFYEIDNRRTRLQEKEREADFWSVYYSETNKQKLSSKQLENRIAAQQERLDELRRANVLRIGVTNNVEATLSANHALSTTFPKPVDAPDASYPTTRELLNDRDDKALEFLRVYQELEDARKQRYQVKAEILATRVRTTELLSNVKSIRSESALKRIHTQSQPRSGQAARNDSDTSEDASSAQKLRKLHLAINETKSKKEMVKGVLRGLVLESGKDWTQSQDMLNLILTLEEEDEDSEDDYVEGSEEEQRDPDDDDEEEEEEEED